MTPDIRLSRTALLHAAAAFRLGREAEASEELVSIIDHLGRNLSSLPQQILADLAALLQQTFDAQARQDPIGVADLLEHELLPKLLPTGLLND